MRKRFSPEKSGTILAAGVYTLVVLLVGLTSAISKANSTQQESRQTIDPAGWGSNHVGKPIPEYVRGDECLFCHRNDIGTTWQKNAHGTTLRQREDADSLSKLTQNEPKLAKFATEVRYFLGGRRHTRFLKKEGYGKLSLLTVKAILRSDGQLESLTGVENATWDKDKFANQCAGCHATAVDPATRAFTVIGLDCSTCHGDVNLEHTNDTSLIWLSKKRRNDPKAITSICSSCHLRGGKSKSTGLTYPNNFVAGDNLFQDFVVDFSNAEDESLNAGDRHIWRNAREVAVYGASSPTCLSCHDVHSGSSFKHRRLPRTSMCNDCHAEGSYKPAKQYTVRSPLCEY
jgi:hypothetical protein